MFGYIMPVLDDLKVRDYEIFRSYYCGLCFSIKNKFGNIPRLGLNYDTTFFAVLLDGLSKEESKSKMTNCIKHPIEKRNCILQNKALDYATDLNLALVYYKLLDDVNDDKNITSSVLSKILKLYHNRLTYKNINSIIKENLDKLHVLERSDNFFSIDEIADPFSHIIGEILQECPFELNNDTENMRKELYIFGYYFGKWIYLIDALDDLKKDMQEGQFNPINKVYNKNSLPYDDLLNLIKKNIEFTLISLASNCSEILKKLPITKNKEILENIINLGLMDKYMNISLSL